ncbi:uncharacterized protein LOC110806946 [Carica papaya]|uniref:uncharacterized protein LOC110806946 n=1 Tax=Carica papaya TaxID=3649 RepID=UPI000B8CCD19|nr:uncharacterized protein LOC110806946 [Carica papaya]
MSIPSFLHSTLGQVMVHCHALPLHVALWTTLLMLTVAVASFAPEIAFISSISPSLFPGSLSCADDFARIPLEFPGETLCLPAHMVRRSGFDFFVPTVLAALLVAASACVIRSCSPTMEAERVGGS